MKRTFSASMLVPQYVTQFHCIGGDCPDTCCAGWNITIDQETFREYRRVTHPVLKPIFKLHLLQNDKNSIPNHGKIELRASDADCALHAADGLCLVQQHLGEAALSNTCYLYPRSVAKFGARYEQSLTLSCPEAARLALTRDDAFEFVSAELTTRQEVVRAVQPVGGFDILAMDEVRTLAIQLFQTQGLSNVARLAFLGWMCNQVDELVASHTQARVLDMLKELVALVETGELMRIVGQLPQQPALGATVFSILFGNPNIKGRSAHQQGVLTWVTQGLGLDGKGATEPAVLETNYLRGMRLLNEDGITFEKMMGRYLTNDLLYGVFPWGQSSAMHHYRSLLTRFGILRLMLSGVAAALDQALSEQQISHVVQVFSRLYQHNDAFSQHAERLLTGSDWDTLDRLYTLLN